MRRVNAIALPRRVPAVEIATFSTSRRAESFPPHEEWKGTDGNARDDLIGEIRVPDSAREWKRRGTNSDRQF